MVRGGLPNIQSRKRPGEVQFLDYSKDLSLCAMYDSMKKCSFTE